VSALKHFKVWVQTHPHLIDNLKAVGYQKGQRFLTPKMVETIVDAFGEP
jgi:hypothetical protein